MYRRNSDFYNSEMWRCLVAIIRERAKDMCERCAVHPVSDVHHLTYIRFGGNERMADLLGVCRQCHIILHDIEWQKFCM